MKSLVSIIMPVKNGLPFLTECIQSILNQTISHWELIAIDDNSTDQTWKELNAFASADSRIIPLKSNGIGILDALNFGVTQATGQIITRMDADDVMKPNKLALMSKACVQGNVVIGLVNYFSEQGIGEGYKNYAAWLNELTVMAANYKDMYKECTVPSSCWMMFRSDFKKCGGFGNRYPEDYDLAFRMRRSGLQIKPVKKVLHQWRDHPTRASRTDRNYADNRFTDLKLAYFNDDRDFKYGLTLIGAGKKGKLIAQRLIDMQVDFNWATNNSKKIGVDIFGKILIDEQTVDKSNQLIIAVAGKEGQILRTKYTSGYFFC